MRDRSARFQRPLQLSLPVPVTVPARTEAYLYDEAPSAILPVRHGIHPHS